MNTIFTAILIVSFSLLSAQVHAATNTYYVTQNGKGLKNGESLGDAWSVSDFNRPLNWSTTDHPNKIDPGDIVYFSGTITSQLTPPTGYGGTAGNYITLDGWEGGTCDPVANSGCASAAVIDRPSSSMGVSNYCMSLQDNSYLVVQDLNMQDSRGGIIATGPSSGSPATHLTIRRNYIHDMANKGAQITNSGSPNYIGINYVTFGGADGDGNFVYDCDLKALTEYSDSHCLGFENTDDLVVSFNRIDNNPTNQQLGDASNTVSVHTSDRVLFEYNTIGYPHGQACVAVKERGGKDKIFRFNKMYGCGQQSGIGVITDQAAQTNYYIYGNLIFNSAGGIFLYRNYDNIHIWSNVIHDIEEEEEGTGDGGIAMDISTDGVPGDVYVYNNTISRGGIDSEPGMRIIGSPAQQVRVKNNIFYYNNNNNGDVQLRVEPGHEDNLVALEHNTYYTDGTPYVYYSSENLTIAELQSIYNFEDGSIPGDVVDPGFTDPNGADNVYGTKDDDYTLNGTNINDGEDLSQCFNVTIQGNVHSICYNDALDPNNTDWTTTPPTVGITKQENHGSWDRGAYAYKEDIGPVSVPPPPFDLQIIN